MTGRSDTHPYQSCRDGDCPLPFCRIWRTAWAEGYAAGSEDGFEAGFAAGAASAEGK